MSPSAKEIVRNEVWNNTADELQAGEQDTKGAACSTWPPDADINDHKQEPKRGTWE